MAVKQLPKISDLPEPPDRLVGDQERFDVLTFNSLKAQKKMVNDDLNKTLIPALNQFAVDVNASVDAAKASEASALASKNSAASSAGTATTKAGEAAASAKAAKTSETSALASKNAASSSATAAVNAQKAAEAARDEAQDLANVGYAAENHAGLAKVDGKTTQADAGGVLTAKDVAIGGDLGDLASARGQIGAARELGNNVDYNTVTEAGFYLINATGGVNGPIVGSAAFLQVFYSKKDAFTKNLYQIVYAYSSARERMFLRQYRLASNDWSSWSEIVSSSRIGDGLTVNNGIISVPEYEGATASAAGTSGLVPPAAAGQQESFLTGGGEYKPALSTGGGVMTGSIQINDPANDIAVAPPANTERGMFLGDKNSVVMGGFDVIQRASDNAKYTQFYSKNSSGHITSIAAVTYEDGTRELVADSPLQINDIQIKQVVDGGRRVIVLSGARGNQGHSFRFSPDTGEAYMDGRVIHAKADTAGYADTAGSAPANGGTAWAANRLRLTEGGEIAWSWTGQGGQPQWLWGGNDGVNMRVYNPANFSVNYANSAGQAQLAAPAVQWVVNLSGPQITVPLGGTYNVVCICFNDSGGKGAVKHYPNIAGGTVIPNAPTDYMVAGLCARVA